MRKEQSNILYKEIDLLGILKVDMIAEFRSCAYGERCQTLKTIDAESC